MIGSFRVAKRRYTIMNFKQCVYATLGAIGIEQSLANSCPKI